MVHRPHKKQQGIGAARPMDTEKALQKQSKAYKNNFYKFQATKARIDGKGG